MIKIRGASKRSARKCHVVFGAGALLRYFSRGGSAGRRRRREEARWFFACRRREEEDFLLDAAVFLLLLCRRSVCSRPACCVLFFGDSCTIHTILILLRSFAITFVFGGRKGVSSSKKHGMMMYLPR